MVEIGMTALAWSHYNYYLGLIASIGVLAIPFFVMIYNNHQETRRSQNAMAASLAESRRTSSDVIMMVVVAALFIVPMQATSINPGQWTHQLQMKQAGIQDADDEEFVVDTNSSIPVPPAWYFITHISKAIVNAYKDIASLDQLDADNLNLMRGFVTAKVADHLKTELEAFINHCYIPVGEKAAKGGWVFNSDTSRSHLDLSYIGNQHYLLGKGLYQYCSESDCMFDMAHTEHNMPYEFASRVTPRFDLIQNITLPDGSTTTQTILPSCYVWWVGRGDSVYPAGDLGFSASRIPSDHMGLRDQLFVNSDFGQGAVDRVNVFNDLSLSARDRFNDSRYRDAVVHRALINTYEGRLTTRTRATDADRSTVDKALDLVGLTAAGGLAS
ncbi:hypothetical protein [Thiomicrospira aerophila]|nr:hypothetical protein [Thiomicrospira aerophila]